MSDQNEQKPTEEFLSQQEKNRQRQQNYRARKKQRGLKQMTVFVSETNPAPVQKFAEEWTNYENQLPEFEKAVRALSLRLNMGTEPHPYRPMFADLADFLAKISTKSGKK